MLIGNCVCGWGGEGPCPCPNNINLTPRPEFSYIEFSKIIEKMQKELEELKKNIQE